MIWIFGYSSLLLSKGIQLAKLDAIPSTQVPCVLNGWRRNWSANRTADVSDRKRFIDACSFAVVPAYAFSSIEQDPACSINGVAYQVSDGDLLELDYREQGYVRVNVTPSVMPYSGFTLQGQVEAYVDAMGIAGTFPVSAEYMNIGTTGARYLDRWVPDFSRDYCRTTPIPNGHIEPMRFVSIGKDGRTLWLLHERTNQKTCLVRFAFSLLDDATISAEETIDWQTPCPQEYQAYDIRYHFDDDLSCKDYRPILADLVEAIWGDNTERFLRHRCWLVRIACLAGDRVRSDWCRMLANDEDDWVRRAAVRALANETNLI